jgi:hypothetical protein
VDEMLTKNTQMNRDQIEMIERVFADAKEKYGMRWTTLRGQKNCPCKRCLLLLP